MKGRNCYNSLNLDIFLNLVAFLDTVSLLNYQAVDKFTRLFTEHGPMWLDRWMWRNRKLQDSLPRGFFDDYTTLKYQNEELKSRKHERTYGSKWRNEQNNLERDGKKKLKFGEIISISNHPYENSNDTVHSADSFKKAEKGKKYKKDFSLLRNVDVTIIQLMLQVVEGVRPLSDLTEYYLHTTFNFLSTNSYSHFMESYKSFQPRGDGNRYFHSIYLLTVIIDINSDTYSPNFRVRFMQNILGDMKYRNTPKLDNECNQFMGGHVNKTFVQVVLSSPSIQNVARLAFLFLRSQLQSFKWNETLHLLSPVYNRNLKVENKMKYEAVSITKNNKNEDGSNESDTGPVINSIFDKNDEILIENKENEIIDIVEEERFSICESFMILADSKSTEDQHFCDRVHTNRVIDKLVFIVHEKIFKNAVYDFEIDILRSRVSRMDRTYVRYVTFFADDEF